jgi:hypothetical protein
VNAGELRRIAIIGNAGGGKSVLARTLSAALDLPLRVVDDVQWKPGWVASPEDYMRAHDAWMNESAWIVDGWGVWPTIERRFRLAHLVVFVDFPLRTHYLWALKRHARALLGSRDGWPPPGCRPGPVTWRLMQVMWRVHRELRPRLRELLEREDVRDRVVRLGSPRELRVFAASHTSRGTR